MLHVYKIVYSALEKKSKLNVVYSTSEKPGLALAGWPNLIVPIGDPSRLP